MREDFLHYLWKFKKFDTSNLFTVRREPIIIIHSGNYLQLSGPDFFNAQLIIGNQKWAGNIEIHVKSSDWYAHHHETDAAYDNVILHVVWEHDAAVFRKNNTEIPVLEIRHFVNCTLLENFKTLTAAKSWIYCEKQLGTVDDFLLKNWLERLYFERLQNKIEPIRSLLTQTNQDWEAVLFCMLAKNFGLNTNGEAFMKIASQIPFAIVRKESHNQTRIEALLFGFANLLIADNEDTYFHELKNNFTTLAQKYNLPSPAPVTVEFFKHRPDNFPTVRLSQFAALYSTSHSLFSKIIDASSTKFLYSIFEVDASKYWQNHYQFDRESPAKRKPLSKSFIDLLIVNTVVPIKFAYAQSIGKDNSDELGALLSEIKPESNAIVDKFGLHSVRCSNVFESQALLQLKNEYCAKGKCLDCAIGISLLKESENG